MPRRAPRPCNRCGLVDCPGHAAPWRWNPRRTLPNTNPRLRLAALRRARNACENCGTPGPLEVDHRVPRSRGGTDRLANLQVLCRRCHAAKTAAEGVAARRAAAGEEVDP